MTRYLLVALILPVIGLGNARVLAQVEDVHSVWAYVHYEEAIDQLLPAVLHRSRPFPSDVHWILSLRVTPAFESEFQLVLKQKYADDLEAEIAVADRPIREQLAELRTEASSRSFEEILSLVAIRRWTVTGTTCKALDTLAQRLAVDRFSIVPDDALYVDGMRYEVVIETSPNERSSRCLVPALRRRVSIRWSIGRTTLNGF